MARVKCKAHRPNANDDYSRTQYLPSGDGRALVCGSSSCGAPGFVWLTVPEEHDYKTGGERVFTVGPPDDTAGKVRVR